MSPEAPPTPRPAPVSTYRLQVTADFDLHAAADLVPYLRDLGVDWVYLSPILEAEPGSDHGYDVISHERVDPSRGGAEGLAALSKAAHDAGLGVLVDIVPNHVGIATPELDAMWWDLLRHGRSSAYADWFDVDWQAGDGRILVPVVGDGDEGSIEVGNDAVSYHEHTFPLAPGTSTLDEQHYRLAPWRQADDQLNYRRFFGINTLAAIRVEDRAVFDASHAEIKRWFTPQEDGRPLVDGLRVDHPDGLRDPGGYLDWLAELTGGAYVLVEKILEPGEEMPEGWATAGTTGYDALAHIDRVLTDPAAQAPLDELEASLRGAPVQWEELVHDRKRDVADHLLGSETLRLVRELGRVSAVSDHSPRLDPEQMRDAVAEILACFGVYRSYLQPGSREGLAHLDQAVADATRRRPELSAVLTVVGRVLADPELGEGEESPALRLQQTSGMVMAKGVEDCSFYRYSRLTSLNEVGGDPSVFSLSVTAFHDLMTARQAEWPEAMTCLSTHDTKRGEDVRARITAVSEIPEAFAEALGALQAAAPLPDPGFGSLLWQAVLGSWTDEPDLRARLHAYAEKAMREAGDHTTWTAPDEAYEAAVHAAVDAAFDSPEARRVLDGLLERVVDAGWSNALSAKLLALTMPGVPDVYQGSELWEQSLVDPDNRRPVDFAHRAELLASRALVPRPAGLDDSGAAKLLLTVAALQLRRDVPALFGSYAAVTATGAAAGHVLAFDRGGAVTVTTRLPIGLAAAGGWGDTVLDLPTGDADSDPGVRWRDLLTGRTTDGSLRDLLSIYPVALLVREAS